MSDMNARHLRRLLFFTLVLWTTGCASAGRGREPQYDPDALPSQPVSASAVPAPSCRIWRFGLHSHVSHISASADGSRILVSTSGEHKKEAKVRMLNARGKLIWSHDLDQPVKAQALSPDGKLAVLNTYDAKMSVFNQFGKKLWERDHLGRPMILPRSRKIILFNDDDSEPKTVFVAYDYSGNKGTVVTLPPLRGETATDFQEPLDMDVSDDESFVAVTTTDKKLLAFDTGGKLLWMGTLPGDSVSIEAVGEAAGKAAPRIYVLTSRKEKKGAQTLSAFEVRDGNKLVTRWSISLDRKYEIVKASGESLFLYGNTHVGQALAAYAQSDGKEVWRHSYPMPASYSSLVFSSAQKPALFTATLDEGSQAGVLHLLGINDTGSALWDTKIEASSGLYSYAFAESAPAVVVGAGEPGDGVVEYFSLKKPATKACN